MKNKLINFIKGPYPVFIVLSIICICLIFVNHFNIENTNLYEASGTSENITIDNVTVFKNNKTIYFSGGNILTKYTSKKVVSYSIGYYVITNNEEIPISEIKSIETKEVNLDKVITNNIFTLNTVNNKDSILGKYKKLDKNKIIFKVDAVTKSNNKIIETVELELNNLV